jgi:hypothetical protein
MKHIPIAPVPSLLSTFAAHAIQPCKPKAAKELISPSRSHTWLRTFVHLIKMSIGDFLPNHTIYKKQKLLASCQIVVL